MDIIDTHCHVVSADLARYPRAPLGGKQSGWATTRPVTADEMA
ncbi:amidohydrolase, partial [Amycolatopsis echigonensis]|nr:amidohydrolase [Amycolatopsis echigonensis]